MNGFGYGTRGGILSSIPPFVRFILIANLAVHLFTLLFANFKISGHSLDFFITQYLALIPFDLHPLSPIKDAIFLPWQLVSYQFLHADFWHLFFNMFGIWMFGSELERDWGSARLGVFYLLCGIGAGLLQIFVSNGPTIGASGALFGVLIAFGMSYPDRKILMFPFFIPISAKYFVAIYAVIELLNGITRTNSNVAHWAHLAGAITGFILIKYGRELGVWKLAQKWFGNKGITSGSNYSNVSGYSGFGGGGSSNLFGRGYQTTSRQTNPFRNIKTRVTRTQQQSYQEKRQPSVEKTYLIDGETIGQSKIDEILDKISASGYQSLSEKEKYILTELSKRI